jgi:Holliday junction resolvase RusA-like endonuclease
MSNASLFKIEVEVERHFILKNSKNIRVNRRTGNRFIASNNDVVEGKDFLTRVFRENFNGQRIESYVNAKMVFIFPHSLFYTKKNERSRRIADLSNLYQVVEDALESSGVLLSDNLIEAHDGSRRLPGPIGEDRFWLQVELSLV